MEREIIASKLDQLELEDLGVSMDSVQLWDQLDERLNTKKRRIGWLVAASIAFMVLLIPISFLEDSEVPLPVAKIDATIDIVQPQGEKEVVIEKEQNTIGGFVPQMLGRQKSARLNTGPLDFPIQLVNEKQVAILGEKRSAQSKFNNKDISVIQATLGKRKAETGRKVTVRAQLYPSSEDSGISYQKLKIKFNAKNK